MLSVCVCVQEWTDYKLNAICVCVCVCVWEWTLYNLNFLCVVCVHSLSIISSFSGESISRACVTDVLKCVCVCECVHVYTCVSVCVCVCVGCRKTTRVN